MQEDAITIRELSARIDERILTAVKSHPGASYMDISKHVARPYLDVRRRILGLAARGAVRIKQESSTRKSSVRAVVDE